MHRPVPPSPDQLLALLEATIKAAPTLKYQATLSDDDLRWLGRAEALIEASGAVPALLDFRNARGNLGRYTHNREELLMPLHSAYSRVELTVPAASQGAFIAGGDTWNGYAALVRLFQQECDDLLVVDPYLDATLFTDLAPHGVARRTVRCLTAKRSATHPGLVAAAARWTTDPNVSGRSVEVRLISAGALHDRLIIIDLTDAWLVSQSLKDIAKRSPASVSRADTELAKLKAQHYDSLWGQADALS